MLIILNYSRFMANYNRYSQIINNLAIGRIIIIGLNKILLKRVIYLYFSNK
jgi:hypothetical protein